jgi:prophage antirepressor-like protein
MKEEIEVLNFEGKDVRIIIKDGEPWYVLKDLCDAIGLADPTVESHVVNESGLYTMILRLSRFYKKIS